MSVSSPSPGVSWARRLLGPLTCGPGYSHQWSNLAASSSRITWRPNMRSQSDYEYPVHPTKYPNNA